MNCWGEKDHRHSSSNYKAYSWKKRNVCGQRQSKMKPKNTYKISRQLNNAGDRRKGARDRSARLARNNKQSEGFHNSNRLKPSFRPNAERLKPLGKDRPVESESKNRNTSGMCRNTSSERSRSCKRKKRLWRLIANSRLVRNHRSWQKQPSARNASK